MRTTTKHAFELALREQVKRVDLWSKERTEDFDPCCRGACTRPSAGSASKDEGFTIISMPTEHKKKYV